MSLEGTVKTPFGPASKKSVAIMGGGAVVILGVVYYRKKQAGNTSAATGTASDGTAADTSQYDPATLDTSGFTYGTGYDPYSQGYGGGGYGYYGGGQNQGSGPGSFTSNSQWSQYVEQYMISSLGGDAATIGNALGKYITGQPLTDAQIDIVNQAIAFADRPPVPGPSGNPPGFIHVPPTGGGGNGTAHNPVGNLHITDVGYTSISIAWAHSANAKTYAITATPTGTGGDRKTHPKPGQARHMTVTGTTARIGNLGRRVHYDIKVRAQPGSTGGTDAHVTAMTK